MYRSGEGVSQDDTQAVNWFRKAAEQGYAKAQVNLGFMYRSGQGVPQDYAQAVNWFRKAAEQGIAVAQYNLGVMYYNGDGVSQDYAQTYAWFSLAVAFGLEQAKKARDVLRTVMTPEQIAEAQALSAQLHDRINGN